MVSVIARVPYELKTLETNIHVQHNTM